MTLNNFLSYLQQLLTMVDPSNKYSCGLVKASLSSTVALAVGSGKADAYCIRVMRGAEANIDRLIVHADEFKGYTGAYELNMHNRKMLEQVCRPHC